KILRCRFVLRLLELRARAKRRASSTRPSGVYGLWVRSQPSDTSEGYADLGRERTDLPHCVSRPVPSLGSWPGSHRLRKRLSPRGPTRPVLTHGWSPSTFEGTVPKSSSTLSRVTATTCTASAVGTGGVKSCQATVRRWVGTTRRSFSGG